jgi:starch-binding outer membrane protein, SusD/RagB family
MKQIKFIITLITSMALLDGCQKNFDPQLYGTLAPANFPSTQSDFESYTMEVYKPFQAHWQYVNGTEPEYCIHGYEYSIVQMFDGSTDLLLPFTAWGGFFQNFSTANFAPLLNDASSKCHFEQLRFITRITQIISDLEKTTVLSSDEQKELIAEAKMSRAWLMYYLLNMYGPLPVILDPTKIGTDAEYDLTRPARTDYVSWTAADLTAAATDLPQVAQNYGRFNKGLALTVLMRLQMNEKDYTDAEVTGRKLLNLGYSLVPNYMDLFTVGTQKNSENIFSLTCDPTADGTDSKGNMNAWPKYCLGNCPDPGQANLPISQQGGWAQVYQAPWSFYDSYAATDTRRQMFITSYTPVGGGAIVNESNGLLGAVVRKYPSTDQGAPGYVGNDIPLARYADVLLLLAEAINHNSSGPTAEAIGFVNQVRERAQIPDLPAADVSSMQAFDDAILRERGWELFFEGQRKMDLVRHDKWTSTLQAVNKANNPIVNGKLQDLFPVPLYAIQAGKGTLTQTPGY